jgi:predicted dehydrogenase
MIHDIDLVLSLVDASVERVEALGVSILGGHEDCAQARIVFANGCIVDLSANRVSPVTRRTMQVWSPEGCTHLDFGAREVVVYGVSPGLRFGMSPLERARQPGADIEQLKRDVFGTYLQVERPVVVACDQLTEELLDFRDCVQTRRPPVVSGVQALDAVRVAGEILERVVCHQWDGTAAGAVGPNPDFRSAHKLAG